MVIANFTNDHDARVTGLDQYDYGQVLRIQGLNLPTAVEIHFGLEETGGTTTTRIGVTKDGVTDVPIPDSMLENGDTSLDYTIYAFIYLTDETSGKTTNRIKIQVKARSKPELLNKPEEKKLFQQAIEAVNRSAKEAEGWAHGREDLPERAQDNAKYYSEQASVSAEEVKGVEQNVKDMVATVDGIEQQVQDVKEYAGQAKTAAENALLSEQEAKKSEEASLQHRTGAETAENNAELAEQNAKKSEQAVEQAKQLVMQMGQQVLQDKNQVAEKVEAFNKVVTDASDAINTKKNESLTEIETVKTDAVDAVGTKGTEQTKKVADEGAKQVKAVEEKGNEVLQSIPQDFTTQMQSKLDKNQGAENAGKILEIGIDGMVVPADKPSGGTGESIVSENYREIRTFTVPTVLPSEQQDVKYIAQDDGRIVHFYVDRDADDSPFELKKVFILIKKSSEFCNVNSDIAFRYNAFTENKNHITSLDALKKSDKTIIMEADVIYSCIKYGVTMTVGNTNADFLITYQKNAYSAIDNTIVKNKINAISVYGEYDNVDFRGATVTILGVDA